jgi:pyruvate ferredoxin oxidoreductase gamma subunit
VKTASRIVGTAAALDGRVAQDSPVYGAERRGAPMAAYVRMSGAPIFERGPITTPDVVVVADDTLLDDPAVQPLAGLEPDAMLLLSTSHAEDETRAHTRHRGPMLTRDFVALALDEVGAVVGVSTALAAATCALLGLPDQTLDAAAEAELVAAGVRPERVRRNLALAAAARSGIAAIASPARDAAIPAGAPVVDVRCARGSAGTPSLAIAPNTRARRTGSWRAFRPVIDLGRCTRCWVCFVWCPDGAIALDHDDTPRVDEQVCKGCLVCAEECPRDAISVIRETRRWHDGEART